MLQFLNFCSKKFLFTIIIYIILSVFSNNVYAFQVQLNPKTVNPGDAFIISINADSIPVVKFNNKFIPLRRLEKDKFIGIIATDIDTEPGNYPINIKSNNEEKTINISVKEHKFKVTYLTLPPQKVFPSKEDLIRAEKEAAILSDIFLKVNPPLWEGNFTKPLNNDISTEFGVKRIMNKEKVSFHKGIDIRGKSGEKVHAINKGKVVLADNLFFGGNTVILDHGQGIYSIYMHLSKINVSKDEIVKQGQIVGLVGATGRATGPHLHFGVKIAGIDGNPVSLFNLPL
jgi:murein DD-endopeptidase MepM/ murein hydrolase activator NlpD